MILVMSGMREVRQALVRRDKIGPRWQAVNFMVERSLQTSDGDRSEKDEKLSVGSGLSTGTGSGKEKAKEEEASCMCFASISE